MRPPAGLLLSHASEDDVPLPLTAATLVVLQTAVSKELNISQMAVVVSAASRQSAAQGRRLRLLGSGSTLLQIGSGNFSTFVPFAVVVDKTAAGSAPVADVSAAVADALLGVSCAAAPHIRCTRSRPAGLFGGGGGGACTPYRVLPCRSLCVSSAPTRR